METKTKSLRWLLPLLSALFLLSCLTACDSTEGTNENEPDKPKPEVPVADGDWQVVPATGGTITKDDITIDFPGGTFSNNAKVAITNLKKGSICGEKEVSSFYMVTMPITTHKPTTYRIKCDKKDDDIQMILHSTYLERSTGETKESDYILDTSYSKGEYIAQLTTFNNDDETINGDFKIGLAYVKPIEGSSARTRTTSIGKGEVRGMKWKLCITPEANDPKIYKYSLNKEFLDELLTYIKDAITIIKDQGYEITDTSRVIPYYISKDKKSSGAFSQHWWSDKYSTITFDVEDMENKLFGAQKNINDFNNVKAKIKATILHETFHYFQADYDPRCTFAKAGGPNGKWIRNENILYEMGAVWIEQTLLDGNLDPQFLKESVFRHVSRHPDLLGFKHENERWGQILGKEGDVSKTNMYQGYSMAPMLYYLTTEKKDEGFDTASVLELHKLWRKKWTDTYTSYNIINEWIGSHDSWFFSYDQIDDYYLKLWKGQLIKDFCVHDVVGHEQNVINEFSEKKKFQFVYNCYPHGCTVNKVNLKGFYDVDMSDKKIVIKQYSKDVHTYVILTDSSSNCKKYRQVTRGDKILALEAGDSIVLNGKVLESLRLTEGNYKGEFCHSFFLLTTNKSNSIYSETINPFQLTFELRDTISVDPKELKYPAEGGTEKVIVNYGSYKYYGYKIEKKDTSWISAEYEKKDGVGVKFSVKPNTTTSPRETTVYCYVSNQEKSTEEQRAYLPVKIMQAAAEAPSVFPTGLTFEATGGTQSVKVTAKGYTKFGFHIDKEYTSWLKGKAISGGTVEITAQPNDTGKKRTATIKCYVTNVDDATDDQKVFMPVEIVQKANTEPEISDLTVTYFNGGCWFMEQSTIEYSGRTITEDPKGQQYLFPYSDDSMWDSYKNIVSMKGTAVHVIFDNWSFDIVNFPTNVTDGYQECMFKNVIYSRKDEIRSYWIEATDIPGRVSWWPGNTISATFSANESDGIMINFVYTYKGRDYFEDLNKFVDFTRTTKNIRDKNNALSLSVDLKINK